MEKVLALGVKGHNIVGLKGGIESIQNVTITTDNFGKKKGLEFSGNSYIRLVDNPLLDFSDNVDFTISVWLKYKTSAVGWDCIMGHPSDYNGFSARESWQPAPYCTFIPRTGGYTTCRYGKVISEDSWHHFALVRKGTEATYYIDGKGTKFSIPNNVLDLSKGAHIGWDGRQSNCWLSAILSDFVIFRDTALWEEDFTPPKHSLTAPVQTLYLDENNAVWGCKA